MDRIKIHEKVDEIPNVSLVYLQSTYMNMSIRICIVSILLCATALKLEGQQQKPDSLARALMSMPDDTTKVNQYYIAGKTFERQSPERAMMLYDSAYALAKRLGFRKGEATYAGHAISILNSKGKFKEALELTKQALAIFETLGSERDLAIAYTNVGSEWHYLSDFPQASENYLKALALSEKIGDQYSQRILNNNLASIFINLQQYEKGKSYAEKSLHIARALKNDYAISSSMFNIATAELYLKQYDSALHHYQVIHAIGIRTDDYIVVLDGLLGQADAYLHKSDFTNAEPLYRKVISYSKEKEAPEYELYAWMGLSDVYQKTKMFNESGRAIQQGMSIANLLGSLFELKDLYLKASELEEKKGDFEQALTFRKKFEMLNDSIVGENSKSKIELLEVRYESEQKAATIRALQAEKDIQILTIRQHRNIAFALAAVVIAVVAIAFLIFRNYRQKQTLQQQQINQLEKEKKLSATEAILKGETQERTRLARDLHDGLGGMLSGIKFSLNTMKENLVMTPKNQEAFERSIDQLDQSIKEMRRVAHSMMPESLVRFGLDIALQDFCKGIGQSQALKIKYQSLGVTQTKFDEAVALTIYRIAQELINNTLKHSGAKNVLVQLSKTDAKVAITVEDDGKGFDTKQLSKSPGIGWANIMNRIETLNGVLDLSSDANGTSIHIEFNT
ncbi:tetratricopeptide repeat-containing sensor histidine kinase [Pseudochryseolinea flava]|uniref:Histidine kinase domain-containing protein n=1 Tax=Pseudochryseolinea flava TaxID=2059302 RepID=A0A364Y2U1_9BACT|nr:tetratricopeptide repeat protein [Pseudochryseolinea flava]RAW01002.1 hypothetical protein DQQ10_12270 [Pseudochryseolinea flava]